MNEALLQYLLESGAGLVLLYLFFVLVLKRETCFQFNRFYLLAAILLSCLLPLSNLPGISIWPQEQEPETALVFETAMEMPLVTSEAIITPEESFDYWNLLYLAYGLGVVFFAGRFLVQVLRLRRFARQEGVSFYLPNQAPVILTNGQFPTFSFWRWVFFDNSQTLTPEETERILQHEQVHIDQRHTLDVLLVSLAGVVFWFNPLLVLYKKALEQTHEFIADAHVAKASGAGLYSSLLVKQVLKSADFPLGSYFFLNKSLTLTRIKMMKRLHESPKLSRMLMVVPVLILVLVAVAAMRPAPVPESSAEATAKVQNGPAQFPGGREALNAYVKNHLVLPQIAFEKRKNQNEFVQVKGSMEVEIDPDGTPRYGKSRGLEVRPNDPEVVKAIHAQFAKMVSQMPKWIPAQKDGKPVASKETISVASVSGNFLSYSDYLTSRQQKTFVTSKAEVASNAVTKRAEYPGGKLAMVHSIDRQFIMPEEVFKLRPAGDSILDFYREIKAELLIDENGNVTQVKVLNVMTEPGNKAEVNQAIGKEFLRAAPKMAQWAPALKGGKPVASKEIIEFSVATGYGNKTTYEQAKQIQEKAANKAFSAETKANAPAQNNIFIAVEQMPEFPGGSAAMFKYLKENTTYPQDAKDANIIGSMVATFVINPEGKVTDVQVLKKLHPSLDQAFVQSLQNMPAWKPGYQNGKAVSVKYTVPYRVVADAAAKGTNEPAFVQEENVFIAVEQMPEFPGGPAALTKYLGENFIYPKGAAEEGGLMIISCVITKEGKVSKVEVLKGMSPDLNQEAVRVVSGMPTWKPGYQNGKPVAVKYVIPYRIKP
ncbi:M56 family metallopeptidase [Rufibacter hautae]|uniref:TonB family protein n=1 Tax=Rufibacter hautae TaxID=2595005 RepID=A0A5B6TBA2_9BACT|nr:M56 family metallopeptidase [Rufibacter hautae]KAA3436413.1 TonB family protein [Rufibacter hautae]